MEAAEGLARWRHLGRGPQARSHPMGLALGLLLGGAALLGGAVQAAPPPGMVLVPAGPFVMGSDRRPTPDQQVGMGMIKPLFLDEHPRHVVELPAYYIDRYEVTNAQYARFVAATGRPPPPHWARNGYLLALRRDRLRELDLERLRRLVAYVFREDVDTRRLARDELLARIERHLARMDREPVTEVTWQEAHDYCAWAGKRLPTEAEWEKAARGPHGQEYPWGNRWLAHASNTGEESWPDGVAPVGSYEKDRSPYGVYDMAGNVSEWVQDWYLPYPGSDYRSEAFGKRYKVIRGAAWGREGHYALREFQRGAYRFYLDPGARMLDVGFRCAMDAPQEAPATEGPAAGAERPMATRLSARPGSGTRG